MFYKKNDFFIILAIIVFSILFWVIYQSIFSDSPAKAEIYYHSQLVKTVDLQAGVEQTFSIPQNKNVVFHLFKDGKIQFEKSNCPDKICIHAGKLHTVGESAACLPNGIILKIVPKNGYRDHNADIIVGK